MGIYDKLDRGESDSLTQFAVVEKLRLLSDMDTLSKQSRTAKLWIMYMSYIDLVKDFICAERTRDWNMHLNTVRKMSNLFSATGHLNYAKSACLYIQEEFPWSFLGCTNSSCLDSIRSEDQIDSGLVCGPT